MQPWRQCRPGPVATPSVRPPNHLRQIPDRRSPPPRTRIVIATDGSSGERLLPRSASPRGRSEKPAPETRASPDENGSTRRDPVGMRRRFLLGALLGLTLLAAPLGTAAAASPTVRLSILHTVHGCHVWMSTKVLGSSTTLRVKPGTRVEIRPNCPMDFDFVADRGPGGRARQSANRQGKLPNVRFPKAGHLPLHGDERADAGGGRAADARPRERAHAHGCRSLSAIARATALAHSDYGLPRSAFSAPSDAAPGCPDEHGRNCSHRSHHY